MNDVQDKVLDDQKSDYADLESLLDAAKSSEFNLSDGFTEEKKEFENRDSFHEKCWNITNIEPKTQETFQKVYMKCQLKQNEIELKCKYKQININ